ncbi:MAG: DUF4358 domain-containing protein [Lachnospiraceae bacterium]|nr:DUF4358 domain-containing protein [Lachnospiraceae bacterium]
MKKRTLMAAALMAAALGLSACQNTEVKETTAAETTVPETEAKKVELADVQAALKEALGEQYIPSMEFDAEMFQNTFGVDAELYDSFLAEGPMISVHVEQFVGVKAKEGKGEEVEKALNAYRDNLVENSMQYPMNMPTIEASQVLRMGDDVYFIMLGRADDAAFEESEEKALESAKENNAKAVKIVEDMYQ